MEAIKKNIIIALDCNNFQDSKRIVEQTFDQTIWYKVGMEAYYSHGELILDYLFFKRAKIFLDLKLHDIPTTVQKSIKSILKKYPVDIINVHALGGFQMMNEVAKIVKENKFHTKVIAVTILTSHTETELKEQIGITEKIDLSVLKLAKLTHQAGLTGVVCSAQEATLIREHLPSNFLIVTPGVRFKADTQDQKRVTTPSQAFKNGATHIVMGREITLSKSPSQILKDIQGSL